MYFFTTNYIYEENVTISGTNTVVGYPEANAGDNNKNTWWESSGALPSLIIDLGQAQVIDSLWLKHANIDAFSLYHSNNGADWTEIEGTSPEAKSSSIYWWFNFAEQTKRYWKIAVTDKGAGNVRIYEVFLMNLRLAQLADDDLPSRAPAIPDDTIGGKYTMGDGSTTSYAGVRDYHSIEVSYEFTPKDNRDNMYLLYSTPILRPTMCIIPHLEYPENIFRVVWADTKFPFEYSISYTGSGFSGKLTFQEW